MSSLEIFLWPIVGFLAVAALAGLWQARSPAAQSAADRAQQHDPSPIARAGRRRALLFAGLALALLAYLLTRS